MFLVLVTLVDQYLGRMHQVHTKYAQSFEYGSHARAGEVGEISCCCYIPLRNL